MKRKKDKRRSHCCYHCGGPLDENLKCTDPDHVGIISRGLRYKLKEVIEADKVMMAYPELREIYRAARRKRVETELEALDAKPQYLCEDPDFEGFD